MPSLTTLTEAQLKFYYENAAKRNERANMIQIVCELVNRGMRCTKYYDCLKWNKRSARQAIEPFSEISRSVRGNIRTDYTPLGGDIFDKMDGRQKYWIDAYTAIKRGKVNATFAVRVRRPGEEATFALSEFGEEVAVEYKDLGLALEKWREIALRASTSQ